MAVDPEKLLKRRFDEIVQRYDESDTRLYALGLGLGLDPQDEGQLAYVYEGLGGQSLRAMPTLVNILAYPGFWARQADTGIDWKRLVHAEQEIVLHSPLPPRGEIVGRTRVTALWDKGADKGSLLQQQRQLYDTASGELVATVTQLNLLRGDGGFGWKAPTNSQPPVPHAIPGRQPDAVCVLPTSPQAALIYRLTGDLNPLHADPGVARAAGFPQPILHGMATMGVAAHAVLRTVLNYRAETFAAMRVRFTAPALPGDTLKTELWVDGDVVSLRTSAVERDVVVLNNAYVRLAPSRAADQ